MNTNVKISLSDLERNHLAIAIDNRVSKRMVSRSEVTLVAINNVRIKMLGGAELIKLEKNDGQANKVRNSDGGGDGRVGERGSREAIESERPASRAAVDRKNTDEEPLGTASYLKGPSVDRIADACSRVLQHIKENKSDETLNLGWCASILLQTGIY